MSILVCPRRKVSLIISFSKWRNRFGKDEAFAQVHVTLSGRTRALTSAALIYKLLCGFSINQVKWWQFASNILSMLTSIHIYTHRPLPCLLGTVCVCVCVCVHVCACVLVTQSCLILCNTMDCSPPGSSVHGILQARILEWLSFPSPIYKIYN